MLSQANERVLKMSDRTDAGVMVRLNVRMPQAIREKVAYWAEKEGLSANDFIIECIEGHIARANGDYDLPTLEQARLAQLVDAQVVLASNVANLQKTVESMAGTIIGLTRGDSYLLDDEDGEE